MNAREFERLRDWQSEEDLIRDFIRSRSQEIWGLSFVPDMDHLVGGIYVKWERGWAAGADLDVRVKYERFEYEGKAYLELWLEVGVNWSSCQRTVSGALSAIELYSEVTKMAAAIETRFYYHWKKLQ